MTEHGPQRESIRDLMGRHGLDPNRMQSERDFIDMMQPYAEDLMTTDHGPQRQFFNAIVDANAVMTDELARLRAENERYAKVCKEIVNLTAFTDSYVWIYIKKLAADALRGEE